MDAVDDVDVLVAGFGPVGAALACLLGNYGVRALAVDTATDIFPKPRAIALDHEALRILQLCGLTDRSFPRVPIPMVRMHSPFYGEFGRMNSAGCIDEHPKLVTFHQPDLERALRECVARHESVTIALGTRVTALTPDANGVTVQLDGARAGTVRARYVVGADGASSFVRQALGLGFAGRTYAEDWLIVDARAVKAPIDHVEFLCDPLRPTPHMVAPDGRQRWEFMLRKGETREEMERPEKLRELLAPWGSPDEMIIERTAVYRFHARVCSRFSAGRVFLVGDAAHVTPPFAGQGLVAGLRDVANLGWKLAWVLSGRASSTILESYDVERRPHAKAMVALATRMGHLIMPQSALKARLVHGLIKNLRRLDTARVWFDEMKGKPENRFTRGLFARGRARHGHGIRRGAWFSQWRERDQLSDDVLGPRLTLVTSDSNGATLDRETEARLRAAGGEWVRFAASPTWTARSDVPWAAVVRPDRIVMHDGPATEASRLVRESLALLGRTR